MPSSTDTRQAALLPPGLRERWQALTGGLKVDPAVAAPLFHELVERYASPPRAYHDLTHVAHCLAEFDLLRGLAAQPVAVEWAIWWHDAVYDPRVHDNEERSAAAAGAALRTLGAAALAEPVTALILATRHAAAPVGIDQQIIVDVDLAILGQPAEAFDAYERAIRAEYAWVDPAAFARGRSAVLRAFRDRPAIYHTPLFQQRHEAAARANLQRALARRGHSPSEL